MIIRDDDKRAAIEEEYEMPIGRLMYHFYHECEMSAGDIGDELGEPRMTVVYWLQQSGIKMRSRTLSDVQRVLIMAYIDAGLGDGAIANRVDCGEMTVNRYRKEIISSGEPVDLEEWNAVGDVDVLQNVVENIIQTEQ